MSDMEWPPMGFFLEEVAQVYDDWHAAEGTAQLVILVFLDTPFNATPMEAAIEKQVIEVRSNHADFFQDQATLTFPSTFQRLFLVAWE